MQSRLQGRAQQQLTRNLTPVVGIDYTSNDFLGLAGDPALLRRVHSSVVPAGSGSSRLLGEHAVFTDAEEYLAAFCKTPSALIFASGYQANVGLLSALLGPDDLVFSDALNHASIIDGIRLGRARKIIYPHLDVEALEKLLQQYPAPFRIIVTESLFGMDGDRAPLAALDALAQRHEAYLVVDEAHATGLWRSGLVEATGPHSRILATVHTGGKALGVGGAWVAGTSLLKDYLVNFCRPLQFSTAPIPLLAVSLKAAVMLLEQGLDARVRPLEEVSRDLRHRLAQCRSDAPFGPPESQWEGPISPVILGSTARGLNIARRMQAAGWGVRLIRPPSVSEGTARLRLTSHYWHSRDHNQRFCADLVTSLRTCEVS